MDNLGIIVGLIDEIRIVDMINNKLGIDKRKKIFNGLMFRTFSLDSICSLLHLKLNCGVWTITLFQFL
ncbi:hypothetical protein [Coleofasciculus sp.]|uniref:hypothetical protein n=1 Tax=Coleofasciculus sp. TaxID=3100458 RepID=UPI003A19ED25